MSKLKSVLAALALSIGLSNVATAQTRTGMQPVGFEAFSPADVARMVEIFQSCPANQTCELAVLAYSFGQFNNTRSFIKAALPAFKNNQKLAITFYLDDGANRDQRPQWCFFRRNVGVKAFWDAVRKNDSALSRDWQQQMAKPAGNFIREMQTWANGRKLGSRLTFIVVPVLEDGGPSGADPAGASGYQRLLTWTKSQMPSGVSYRRSSTARGPDRALSLEFHDNEMPTAFRSGDVITPDGESVSDSAWQRIQANAIGRGGSGLFWTADFNNNNGAERTAPPWQRGVLKPFTNDPALVQRAKAIIATRR